ncbi:hypothetical protein [Mesorhizobium sp. M1E.F.Ca.ET.041.01.1.1]|uniref:hypothetical protein n=1 Tax=Mesorhizobium sp. M1E.F.Ca.ET.041.01.1.1 TaxID=2496759 RepID=UPI000FCCC0D5|nr:hypothetical protein [Mesorhizobium sp. M1E.F.Ca.ET.041.01.1.1]RUW37693.1 hypothetical protein EOA38_03230 [Mesorhizobium sp. M1E.F.Ca.ET.041.01.1.1]
MSQMIWSFETRDFKVVCEAAEPSFIDPLVHSQEVIDAIERGDAMLTHLHARVYWRGEEVGRARKIDCIHGSAPLPDDSEYRHAFDSAVVIDHGHRHKVARWAISDARKTLAEVRSDLPDLHLRQTT